MRPMGDIKAILLVRHGRPALNQAGVLDADGFRNWCAAYDEAELAANEFPPPCLRRLAQSNHAAVVASDRPRAAASGRALAPNSRVVVSALLREPILPTPRWQHVRLPLILWRVVTVSGWRFDWIQSEEPIAVARLRAAMASQWLSELTTANPLVIAVTHGSFRRLLVDELRSSGWNGHKWHSEGFWSAWQLTRTEPGT
jgi:broad specificity phosphatase PhoE